MQKQNLLAASFEIEAQRKLHALCLLENAIQAMPGLSSSLLPTLEQVRNSLPKRRNHEKKLNVLFVLHGAADSNSGYHVQLHAQMLSKLGADCLCAVPGEDNLPSTAVSAIAHSIDQLQGGLRHLAYDTILNVARANLFHDEQGPEVVFAWTPRENVRKFYQAFTRKQRVPLVVHLEDNEETLTALATGFTFDELCMKDCRELDTLVSETMYHPILGKDFLREASALTYGIDTLSRMNESDVPELTIGAPVDNSMFFPMPLNRKFRHKLGITDQTTVLCYNGNSHTANVAEVAEVYQAVDLLNEAGRPTHLLRTGKDFTPFPYTTRTHDAFHELGWVPRSQMPEILAAADVYVQPGTSNQFNDERVPSKLPEYFAMNRPVVLPQANIGKTSMQTPNRWILPNADAAGIAKSVKQILAAPKFAKLSQSSRFEHRPVQETLFDLLLGIAEETHSRSHDEKTRLMSN